MSWLRDHFYDFVFPAFLCAEKRTDSIGSGFDVKASEAAPKRLPTELRKLWTLCQEHNVKWSYDVRESGIGSSEPGGFGFGGSKYRESAQVHTKILRNTLHSALVSMRAEGCSRLFLGGRDVWAFSVICHARSVPHLFLPELSRYVSADPVVKAFLESRGFTGDELFLDTGFMGSIPRNMEQFFGRPFKFRLMSQNDRWMPYLPVDDEQRVRQKVDFRPEQIFPNRVNARAEALETEYLSKYWKTGTVVDGKVAQFFSKREAIARAAVLTSQIWRGVDSYESPSVLAAARLAARLEEELRLAARRKLRVYGKLKVFPDVDAG